MGDPNSRGRPDSGQNRSLRRVSYGCPCLAWRLAIEAQTAVHSGHEGIGLVVDVGTGVNIVKNGDRVGVPWLYSACGHCEYCLSAWETVCADAQYGGYTKNGGFADYILADPNYVAHIPVGLKATEAARSSVPV